MKKLGLLLIALVACAPAKDKGDTTTLAAPDTMKPAPPPVQAAAKTAATKTKSSRSTKGTKGLGRDSVIRFDLKNPRRNLPRADSSKKPEA